MTIDEKQRRMRKKLIENPLGSFPASEIIKKVLWEKEGYETGPPRKIKNLQIKMK